MLSGLQISYKTGRFVDIQLAKLCGVSVFQGYLQSLVQG
jgi:hypothetical protein